MLVLTRGKNESIIIGDTIKVVVLKIQGDKVRLGISAPDDVDIHREEVYEAIKRTERDHGRASERPESGEHPGDAGGRLRATDGRT